MRAFGESASGDSVVSLRNVPQNVRFTSASEVVTASRETKRATLLFAIEEQNALAAVPGTHVVSALEQGSSSRGGRRRTLGKGALVARLASGVVGTSVHHARRG